MIDEHVTPKEGTQIYLNLLQASSEARHAMLPHLANSLMALAHLFSRYRPPPRPPETNPPRVLARAVMRDNEVVGLLPADRGRLGYGHGTRIVPLVAAEDPTL